jgi:hypothetical protein
LIIGIRAFQDKGKTALAIAIALELCLNHGYSFSEIHANLPLNFPIDDKSHLYDNIGLRKYIHNMVENGERHKIVIIDEADRVFPARFWQKPEQTEALIGLWQDYKLFNYVIYTAHGGTGVDVVLRQVTQIELEPDYDPVTNSIPFVIYNAIDGYVSDDRLLNVSERIFPYYNRWARVV